MAAAFQTISVAPLIGSSSAGSPEQGELVYQAIAPLIESGQMVVLDFIGITWFSNPFFFEAVGRLYEALPGERIRELLVVEGLIPRHKQMLECVEEESEEYFKDPESFEAAYRRAMDAF